MEQQIPEIPHPLYFRFELLYMGRIVLLQTVRPMHFKVHQLCSLAAMVVVGATSPNVQDFNPKATLPWAHISIDVPTDDCLAKIVRECILRGFLKLEINVLFRGYDEGAGCSQQSQPARGKLAHLEDLPTIVDGAIKHPILSPSVGGIIHADPGTSARGVTTTIQGKRRYKCKKCGTGGHSKRTCKAPIQATTISSPEPVTVRLHPSSMGSYIFSYITLSDIICHFFYAAYFILNYCKFALILW